MRSWPVLTAMPLALLAGLLWLPVPVSAQSGAAYLSGAEPWIASDCTNDVPIVVASDAAAQSDIYSAVTLAGAVNTDCVVLAGARSETMPAAQRERLDAAATSGYVVGGTAAVPASKLDSRNLMRIGGTDRWVTAHLIGNEAREVAGIATPDSPITPDTTLDVPADAQEPGVFLSGAEPWIASDCSSDVPIVVASDAAAQSDIYSAVTLAGAVGTDCVILAGARSGYMARSQRARLAVAAPGGYVVGGTAAVPTAKIAERGMTRLAGSDRWRTAQLVGQRASGDSTAGTSTTTEIVAGGLTTLKVGRQYACGLLSDSTVTCWGYTTSWPNAAFDPPSGTFTEVAAGSETACAVRSDGTVTCWGARTAGVASPPSGRFTEVAGGSWHACGLRSDGTATCWGYNRAGQTDPPSGTFTALAAGDFYTCGLRSSGKVICWGDNGYKQTDAPSGTFTALSGGAGFGCGVRSNGSVTCWGRNDNGQTDAPPGTFIALAAGAYHACGLRSDGTATCWGWNNFGQTDAPPGIFKSVGVSRFDSFGLGRNGTVRSWGARYLGGR